MQSKLLSALALGTALVVFSPAIAEDGHRGDHEKKWEEIQNMSPEEREKFHQERKAKWDGLSKEEKLKMIEERRTERRKRMDEKWGSMSDDEKIRHVEKRMERKRERKHDRREDRRDERPDHGGME